MADVLDVGAYIYRRQGWLDAWSLEKLTYFAQVWHLVWDGMPLFNEQFEAWRDGPVSPKLHQANKYQRDNSLSTQLPGGDPNRLNPDQQAIVDAVLDYYGDRSRDELIELSHADPWTIARGDCGPHEKCYTPISVAHVRKYYSRQAVVDPTSAPTAPAVAPGIADELAYDAVISSEMARWEHTLEWLADR